MNKVTHTPLFGEVINVPWLTPNSQASCTGCVADHAPGCHTLPDCMGTIFIKNTPEAIAEYVKLRMSQ